jgi:dTDP-4-dehydrorhamnose 3,5-epimerase
MARGNCGGAGEHVRVVETALPGVLLVEPDVHADARGRFAESWNRERYAAAGICEDFTQDNLSVSHAGVLRGLHLQGRGHEQAKLITAVRGAVFDVAVDVRRGSPHFGRWVGCTLSEENGCQLYIPGGFAHGFAVAGGEAVVMYKVTGSRDAGSELAIAWDDRELAISWPVAAPLLSERDRLAPPLRDIPHSRLPLYSAAPPLRR